MAFVQFTQPDDQPIVINTDRIVTATPLPDGQGTRITFNNGVHQDVKQLIADVLRQLNISASAQDIAAWANHSADQVRSCTFLSAAQCRRLGRRPLRSRIEPGWDGEHGPEGDQDQAQKLSQPGEDTAEVIADGGEDYVGCIAGPAFEVTAAEVAL
jgi:hypothetical protein